MGTTNLPRQVHVQDHIDLNLNFGITDEILVRLFFYFTEKDGDSNIRLTFLNGLIAMFQNSHKYLTKTSYNNLKLIENIWNNWS
ncbi:hypothetical protein ACJX0J_031653, partial [Zea mays]